jgi:hypothetical protein
MNKKMRQRTRCLGQGENFYRLAGRLIFLLALSIFCSRGALAQLSTADILGTVTDVTGALIPNATVTLVNIETHDQRRAHTNDSGNFLFSLLLPGHYSVTAKMAGFKTSTTPDLAVEAGDRARADIRLEAGGATETVVVESTTPLLQADNITVSSTVTSKAVQDFPLNGRNFVQLVQLVPGANEGPGNGLTSGGRPDDRRSTNGFSVNGQDDTLNNFVVDGIDDNERIIGTIGVKPSIDAIQEITVETTGYAPEAGRTAGGVINLVTKSGTKKFHGTAYEFFRNDKFDGRNWFQTTGKEPELRQNQFGGSISGPMIQNKTFFFGDYEGLREVSGTTYTSQVPSLTEYNAINSLNGLTPRDLLALGNGTAAYTTPDPVALAYLQLFPAPNIGANSYIISPNKTQFSHTFDVRVDHTFNQNNHFFGRFNYNRVNTNTPPYLPAGANPNAPADLKSIAGGGNYWAYTGAAKDDAQQYAFGYSHIFTQNLLVDLRAAFTRVNNFSTPLNFNSNADVTIGFPANGDPNLTSALTPVDMNGFASLGDGAYVPLQDIDSAFQYSGTVSYTIGNHNLKLGASLIRRQARNLQSAFPFGHYSGFGLTTDSNADQVLASMLAGAFTGSSYSVDLNTPDYRTWEPGFFAQDNWKVNPKLTVVYGFRYDIYTPFTEAHNHISNFDYTQAYAATTEDAADSALKVAGVNGVSATAGIQTVHSDFAPRFGFSYSIRHTTVIRGGYGISYFPGNYTANADLKNAPFTSVYSPNCESQAAYDIQIAAGAPSTSVKAACSGTGFQSVFDAGLPTPSAQTINSPALSFFAEDPKFKPSMIQQFDLQVEQQFGPNVLTVGYVGNIGQHLPEPISDINDPTPSQVLATGYSTPRPLNTLLPNVGTVDWLASEGISNYNGLQTSFQRRFAKGLAFDANYTWAHALSDIVGFSEEGMQGWADADPTNIRKYEYGNAENDIRNRFALSIDYELPFKHFSNRTEKLALGGWQVNSIVVWQSGKNFSITNSSNYSVLVDGVPTAYNNWATPQFNGGPDRPNQVGDPFKPGDFAGNPGCKGPTSLRSIGQPSVASYWFNPCAFVPQPMGTVGNTGRNSLYGPHFRHIDFSLFKDFPLVNAMTLQFRAEAFNITNTPSFYIYNNINSGPGTRLGNSQFGQVTDADPSYAPRVLQFALKLRF